MTRGQREKIANIAGRIWAIGELKDDNKVCQVLRKTATVLNEILKDDLKAQVGETYTVPCNAEGKVDET